MPGTDISRLSNLLIPRNAAFRSHLAWFVSQFVLALKEYISSVRSVCTYAVLEKLRPVLYEDAQNGRLAEAFRALEKSEDGPGRATKEAAAEVFAIYGLMNDAPYGLQEHDVRTIVRAGMNKLPTFDYHKLIDQIVSPCDEFK